MSALGPKIVFTPEEKVKFNPHFLTYLKNPTDSTLAVIKKALGNDNNLVTRFTLYTNALMELIKLRKDKEHVADLNEKGRNLQTAFNTKANLKKSIMARKRCINESRDALIQDTLVATTKTRI